MWHDTLVGSRHKRTATHESCWCCQVRLRLQQYSTTLKAIHYIACSTQTGVGAATHAQPRTGAAGAVR
jgi:hypothetical protein